MNTGLKLQSLYHKESLGSYGAFEIEINVGASKLPDFKSDEIWRATHDAVELIESAVMEQIVKNDPQAIERAKVEKQGIVALFPDKCFVKEIPNGYCSRWCCKHLPWFVVTTPVGPITIGWRKRVIEINWNEVPLAQSSGYLFPNEDVTKDDKMIHAWSLEKAKEYIAAIIASVKI